MWLVVRGQLQLSLFLGFYPQYFLRKVALVWFPGAVIMTKIKESCGQGFISLMPPYDSPSQRGLQGGSELEAMEEHCLLSCTP